eukprot:767903-Hanusia_phi.AAC.4
MAGEWEEQVVALMLGQDAPRVSEGLSNFDPTRPHSLVLAGADEECKVSVDSLSKSVVHQQADGAADAVRLQCCTERIHFNFFHKVFS